LTNERGNAVESNYVRKPGPCRNAVGEWVEPAREDTVAAEFAALRIWLPLEQRDRFDRLAVRCDDLDVAARIC
jgi:hypothetical protein